MAAQEETEYTPSHKHTEFTPTDKAITPKEELGVNWTPSAQQMRETTQKQVGEMQTGYHGNTPQHTNLQEGGIADCPAWGTGSNGRLKCT